MLGQNGKTLSRHGHFNITVNATDISRDMMRGKKITDSFAPQRKPQSPGRWDQRGLGIDP